MLCRGHGFSFVLVMEKSWKIHVEKEGHPGDIDRVALTHCSTRIRYFYSGQNVSRCCV